MSAQPLQSAQAYFQRDRIARLGSEAVVHERHRGMRVQRQLTGEPALGVFAAEHPVAVQVQHHRQGAVGALGPVDGQTGDLLAGGAGDQDLRLLHVAQGLAPLLRRHAVQEGWTGGGVGEGLGGRVQHRLGHEGS